MNAVSLRKVEEAKTFLEVCEQENELIPFLLAIFTGMRRGEILDLEKGVIHVEESLISPYESKRLIYKDSENIPFGACCVFFIQPARDFD